MAESAYYDPAVFCHLAPDDVERAKWIILNPDGVHTTEERWELETRWLVDKITTWMPPHDAICLDYGCGIGRLAKPLIEERNWSVMGVDISPAMMGMAAEYVGPRQFLVCAPSALDTLLPFGVRFDFAISVWALQHAEKPQEDIDRIRRAVKPGGRVFVVNAMQRFVPANRGLEGFAWANDGINVWDLLKEAFVPLKGGPMPTDLVPAPPSQWAVYERPTDDGSNPFAVVRNG